MAWKPKWDALRSTAQRIKKKKGTLPTRDVDDLLGTAEELLDEIAGVIWLAADAANITLYPWGENIRQENRASTN